MNRGQPLSAGFRFDRHVTLLLGPAFAAGEHPADGRVAPACAEAVATKGFCLPGLIVLC